MGKTGTAIARITYDDLRDYAAAVYLLEALGLDENFHRISRPLESMLLMGAGRRALIRLPPGLNLIAFAIRLPITCNRRA